MATIEDVKNKLAELRATIAAAPTVTVGGDLALADVAAAPALDMSHVDAIGEALAMLDTIPDAAGALADAAHQRERRRGARARAKLDAAHGIRAKLDAIAHAVLPEGNTWRDGFVAGLDFAHGHVQGMSDADVDDGD